MPTDRIELTCSPTFEVPTDFPTVLLFMLPGICQEKHCKVLFEHSKGLWHLYHDPGDEQGSYVPDSILSTPFAIAQVSAISRLRISHIHGVPYAR